MSGPFEEMVRRQMEGMQNLSTWYPVYLAESIAAAGRRADAEARTHRRSCRLPECPEVAVDNDRGVTLCRTHLSNLLSWLDRTVDTQSSQE